jgi:thiamine biosynthesis lipoprotein
MDRVRPDEAILNCERRGATFRYRFRAMASLHELMLGTPDRVLADRAAHAAIDDVLRIEAKYSRYRDDSVTSAINRAAGARAVPIDAETAALLAYAERCHALSGGRFDVTSGVLRRAWDFSRTPPRLPTEAQIEAARARVGWERVEWNERSVRLAQNGMELDFGGIGKEYAADRAATICSNEGIGHVLVNLGGDVRACGGHPMGGAWQVGIQHPRTPGATIGTIAVVDGAVATSGDYERYFELDGRRYCHVLDALTGVPVRAWQSVTVLAPLAVVAGSYATIAMLLEASAVAFLERQRVSYLMVAADGSRVERDVE